MNIFERFKKRNKYEEVERLFDKIVALFPDGSASLDIHRIDLNKLDKKVWDIERRAAGMTNKPYGVARRINRKNAPFGIVLFGEVKK